MKITLSQVIPVKGDKLPHLLQKDFQSMVIPHKGCTITDSIWEEPSEYEVVEVIINYQEEKCYVSLESYQHEIANIKAFREKAKQHGWYSPLDRP